MADNDVPLFGPQSQEEGMRTVPPSDLDGLLTAQLVVAWAGENGEERRLGWWDSDLTGELGGEDLFQQLLPETWAWATLQAARAAAIRRDVAMRAADPDPDGLLTLFTQGFAIDELVEERLQDLKQSGQSPLDALPGLRKIIDESWNRERFAEWLDGFDAPESEATPIGRRIKGPLPDGLDRRVRKLLGALKPLAERYPLPHYRRAA
jgi:hypothetical protein